MISKRKSFHLFRNTGNETILANDIKHIKEIYETFIPLCPDIKTAIRIVPANKTTCKRGQQCCILLYSEKKDNYLQNIGYLGEQLDLYLVSQNISFLICSLIIFLHHQYHSACLSISCMGSMTKRYHIY